MFTHAAEDVVGRGYGLGTLVGLTAVSMIASLRKAQDIYAQLDALNAHHAGVEESLRRLRSDVNLSGIFVRDYHVARERAPSIESRLLSSGERTWPRSQSSEH